MCSDTLIALGIISVETRLGFGHRRLRSLGFDFEVFHAKSGNALPSPKKGFLGSVLLLSNG